MRILKALINLILAFALFIAWIVFYPVRPIRRMITRFQYKRRKPMGIKEAEVLAAKISRIRYGDKNWRTKAYYNLGSTRPFMIRIFCGEYKMGEVEGDTFEGCIEAIRVSERYNQWDGDLPPRKGRREC